MALPLIAAGAQMVGGLFQGFGARKAQRAAAAKQRAIDARMRELENNRQEIINPFENAANMLSNPFANLQVATQAAEMKAEQADLSLASSLDTLRATGASAGGATALAQAALKSKRGIAASIEQQEAQNAKLRAQGQQQLQGQLFQAEAKGKQFMFGATERREMQQLNRLSSLSSSASQQAAAYGGQAMAGFGQAIGGLGSFAMAGGFGGGNNNIPVSEDSYSSSYNSLTPAQQQAINDVNNQISGIGFPSDKRLKKNIKLISKSNSGLNVYSFEYINKNFGEGVYQGVMSDEIPTNAIIKHKDGFDRVDYSKLDVEFKLI